MQLFNLFGFNCIVKIIQNHKITQLLGMLLSHIFSIQLNRLYFSLLILQIFRMYNQKQRSMEPLSLKFQLEQLQKQIMNSLNQNNSPAEFFFMGSYVDMASRIDSLSDESLNKIKSVTMFITGRKAKDGNQACACLTCLFGCILCFPFCFTMCSWWKKIALDAFEVPIQAYQSIAKLLLSPNIKEVKIAMQDNCMGVQKADIFYNSLVNSGVKSFTLTNIAEEFSYGVEDCYDNFQVNFLKVRSLGQVMTQIEWKSYS